MSPKDGTVAGDASGESQFHDSMAEDIPMPMPGLDYLFGVVRRNAMMSILLIAMLSPVALIAVLRGKAIYESTLIIHYDNNDVLDFESAAGHSEFPIIFAFMKLKLTDIEFMEQLATIYPATKKPALLESLPLPQPVLSFVKGLSKRPPSNASELTSQARALMESITVSVDLSGGVQTPMLRLVATAPTSVEAQRLASAAGKLLSDYYYADELRRASSKSAYFTAMLAKPMVRDLGAPPAQKSDAGRNSQAEGKQQLAESRLKSLQIREKIRQLTENLASIRLRRAKLEQDVEAMALRYGPFHPKMASAKRELAEFTRTANEKVIADQLSDLQEQLLSFDTEGGVSVMARRPPSGAEEVVQGLPERLSLYLLKQLALEQQSLEPAQRIHLSVIGDATLAPAPVKSQRPKMAIMAIGFIVALVVVVTVVRELLATTAVDAWPVAIRYRLHSLMTVPPWVFKRHERLDAEAVRSLISDLIPERSGALKRGNSKKNPVLLYRTISHWMHTKMTGHVLLVLKGAEQPSCSSFIANLANIYSIDYAGRVLVIDFDVQDPVAGDDERRGQGMADILIKRENWKSVCQYRNSRRSFDLVQSAVAPGCRMSELLSAPSFNDLMATLKKNYSMIIVIGFGAEQFVENSSLLSQASDTLLIVEANRSKFKYLSQLVGSLPKGRQHTFVTLDSRK